METEKKPVSTPVVVASIVGLIVLLASAGWVVTRNANTGGSGSDVTAIAKEIQNSAPAGTPTVSPEMVQAEVMSRGAKKGGK